MSKKKINKRCKLTKELFGLLDEMCGEITPYHQSWFRKKYSKRKTIELEEINRTVFKLFMAAAVKNEDPRLAASVMDKYHPKLVLYTSNIHTNNK